MKLDKKVLESLPDELETALKTPRIFLGQEAPSVVNFIEGMKFMYAQIGILAEYQETFKDVVQMRGWRFSAHHPYREMKETGMSEDNIVSEVLTIEIEVWRKILANEEVN